ncbi:MAG TPA: hypothetical protein VFN67_42660 [Polyangiales bacterium]|nr:hypothetical protein [Polyangiales bacterium]
MVSGSCTLPDVRVGTQSGPALAKARDAEAHKDSAESAHDAGEKESRPAKGVDESTSRDGRDDQEGTKPARAGMQAKPAEEAGHGGEGGGGGASGRAAGVAGARGQEGEMEAGRSGGDGDEGASGKAGGAAVGCGNAVLDEGEACESGTDTPCPERCDDGEPCSEDRLEGSAVNCDARCSFTPITQPMAADGCCQKSSNANTDPDCEAVCGNGVIETGERCDGACPSSASECNDNLPCTRDEVSGSECQRHCIHPEITGAEAVPDGCCPKAADSTLDPDCKPVCGNRLKEAGEQCDDGNKTAADGCNSDCEYDDNTATPGDDRPGYVACGAGTCGPDAHCCIADGVPTSCVGQTAQCPAPYTACDGPEDCKANEECWSERYGFCAPSEQSHGRGSQLCHSDGHCDAGMQCSMSGTCQATP